MGNAVPQNAVADDVDCGDLNHERKQEEDDSDAEGEVCAVCLSKSNELKPFSKGVCPHMFCIPCLRSCALHHHDRCPTCRAPRTVVVDDLDASVLSNLPDLFVRYHTHSLQPALQRHGLDSECAVVAFDSLTDGSSLNTLRRRLTEVDASLILLKVNDGEALGVFTDFSWRLPCRKPFGDGACFVSFAQLPSVCVVWPRQQTDEGVMQSKPDLVSFGPDPSGESEPALSIHSCLRMASCYRSDIFDNITLGEVQITRVVALCWRQEDALEELEIGTPGEQQRAAARMLISVGTQQTLYRDWFS